jgi:hypothetical protein
MIFPVKGSRAMALMVRSLLERSDASVFGAPECGYFIGMTFHNYAHGAVSRKKTGIVLEDFFKR